MTPLLNISAAGAVDRELGGNIEEKMRVGRPIIIKTLFLTKVFKRISVPDAVVGALRSLDIVVRLNWPADNY